MPQLAYSFDIALQNELTIEENKEILLRFLDKNFISRGMICDVAIHDPPRAEGEERNLHAHFLCPMRPILENSEWGAKREHIPVFDKDGNPVLDKKGKQKMDNPFTTDWGKAETLEEWRENWEHIVNEKFGKKGLSCRIDHRSNADRGIDDIPQVHEGSAVRRMEKRGIVTYKGSWNRWVKKTNDNIHRLLNKIRELAVWIAEAKEKVRRIENPTITDMVMQYYEHRDEVAEGYSKGTKTAKKGNLKLASEMVAYIQQNNLTDIDALEALIKKKDKELSDSKTGLDDKRSEIKEIKKGLRLIDDYYDNKAIYDASQQIFFKSKKHEYQEAHRPELNKFYKARRLLKEMGHEEADYDVVKNYWEARLETLKKEIADETKEINDSALGREVKMLSWIKEAVDFATKKNDDDNDGDGDNNGAPSGGDTPQMESEAEKKAKEEAQEAARQAANQQVQSQSRADQQGHRRRVSLKSDLNKKIEVVRKYDEDRQAAISRGEITRKKRDDQNLS